VPDRGLTWPDHGQNQGRGRIRLRVVFAPRCTPETAECPPRSESNWTAASPRNFAKGHKLPFRKRRQIGSKGLGFSIIGLAVLDEEATPDRPVTPAPQNDPTPPSERIEPARFVHSPAAGQRSGQQHRRKRADDYRDEDQRL